MAYHLEPDVAAFYRNAPKTETHLHIEGALPWEMLNKLNPGKFPSPPESWDDDYKFSTFEEFESPLLEMAGAWFQSEERYHEAASTVFQRLYEEQGVRYLETSFASGVVEFMGLNGAKVAEALKRAAPSRMELRVFMGIHHDGYSEQSKPFIDECLRWDALDGLDLHGTETVPLESWTAPLWENARACGKLTKAHAGEFCGPGFIRQVLKELGVNRIEHGTRAVEDDSLINELKEQNIGLDLCPISNVKLRVVPSMKAHPFRKLFEAGLPVTLNTDDPISFGNTLEQEYAAMMHCQDFSISELGEVMKNGFRIADLSSDQIEHYCAEIDSAVSAVARARKR